MSASRSKIHLWMIAALAAAILAAFALVGLTVPRGAPDEAQARRNFLAEHPGVEIDRVAMEEQEVVAISYRIFYRSPGDPTLHEELRHYLHTDGAWRIISNRNDP